MNRADFPVERQAVIDLEAIRQNVRRIADISSPAKVMAVVKADGYGHGAVPVAKAALEAGASWIGTAHVNEALALREAGIDAPLLAWLHTPATDFAAAVEAGIDLGVSGWELEYIVAAAREQQRPARVHLKIDTGLGRNGSTSSLWESLIGEALEHQDEGLLRVVGLFSHLAVADEPNRAETDDQLARFREAVAIAEDSGVDVEVRHLANTPAIFSRPDTHFDLVRAGVGIYGLSPFAGQTSEELGLTPAMTLKTLVAHCKDVPADQGVSYGLNYRTAAPSTLGLIPMGYGDGVPRVATGGPVRIGDQVYSVVGRIAMDQMVVDLGPNSKMADGCSLLGHEAVLFGAAAVGDPSVDLWAAAAGTINYEVVIRIAPRVPRIYLHASEPDIGEGTV
ncbi:alanine racemase [Renibacterium salmoninarum ATCC 33209]|uniref:Alanine racemase n=1 Tax=Renibacterium salmoninarum (strain ATCC 33209 / DSM 20767 / JCM 11484 / NBRC 15589 / NCIMB 2235) TaxID=288705 RepID=A9WMU1_RENSM|nr:alanine racemase [Renibacterium salmoninarum]ABY23436.1 alanine racemase [Renibacterium salmoninarum ATCC 33209]